MDTDAWMDGWREGLMDGWIVGSLVSLFSSVAPWFSLGWFVQFSLGLAKFSLVSQLPFGQHLAN